MNELLNTDALNEMAWSAQDMDKDVYICRSEIDESVIMWISINREEFHNDSYEDEMWNSDHKEANRYYYR